MDWPKITKDTPLEEIRRIHKAIWQYVVENRYKPDTPYRNNCVLCEHTLNLNQGLCINCPAKWKTEGIPYEADNCYQKGSPYYWWKRYIWGGFDQNVDLKDISYTETQLAEMVRDIPFKGLDDKKKTSMSKIERHMAICRSLNAIYEKKNHDYGDSFHETFKEEGFAMARIRLSDKLNRFKTLTTGSKQKVSDETIVDTLMDLANYAIMTIMEVEDND